MSKNKVITTLNQLSKKQLKSLAKEFNIPYNDDYNKLVKNFLAGAQITMKGGYQGEIDIEKLRDLPLEILEDILLQLPYAHLRAVCPYLPRCNNNTYGILNNYAQLHNAEIEEFFIRFGRQIQTPLDLFMFRNLDKKARYEYYKRANIYITLNGEEEYLHFLENQMHSQR